MGLLDDAIKEHLELKRRRGADPTEIERQESEALGPVRRGEVDLAERPQAGAVSPFADEEPALEEEPEPVPAPDPETRFEDEPLEEDPGTRTPPHGDPVVDPSQPTQQFSAAEVEEALGGREPAEEVVAADDDEAGDVLEETPEFLEETPEHDRLWFEQKPPKDFDF